MTFNATVNPVVYEGGTPIFIDTEYALNPLTLFSAFFAIKVAIPTLVLANESAARESISNSYLRNSILDDNIFFEYSLLQVICFFVALLGIQTILQKHSIKKITIAYWKEISKNE